MSLGQCIVHLIPTDRQSFKSLANSSDGLPHPLLYVRVQIRLSVFRPRKPTADGHSRSTDRRIHHLPQYYKNPTCNRVEGEVQQ